MDPAKIALLFALSSALLPEAVAVPDDDTLTPSAQVGAVWKTSNMGEGVVIGVLDDGIDAGHPSFGDEGMPPPPARWRGRCKHPGVASCNNKLVGAREFTRHLRNPARRAPRAGTHGTHASSIAAGTPVRSADGGAVVSGVAPRAHLAFYQVCAGRGCTRSPIMHAVETALADGVDILSMSLGDDDGVGFHEDPVVAATFSAVMKGVFVCAAAGNKGPTPGSVANDAPWVLTVGASSESSPHPTTVAAFSSRGPSRNNGGVLKPEIVGPGVDILAAVPRSPRGPSFASLSGTSMSVPHLSGVAALIKSAHPTWSPAAIKSAIMTTADTSVADETGAPAGYFAMGAGLVNPAKAIDPGMVYDISPEEYIPYLCGLGYTDDQVNRIIYPAPAVHCADMENTEAKDLNTPSIMVALTADRPAVAVRRMVTNVGAAGSVYRADVSAPEGVSVTVIPGELQFDEVHQKASFTVTVERAPGVVLASDVLDAQIAWVSQEHAVRSPISISARF
ncbi:hypothetical protein PAHAL_1G339200 [Panicum hallii]|jgi:subtilisin family serine protease|uniref:Peptidase S8/S53 domain-containing protein n=2 Tax=Panicum hallii TaxID=206008 RepID=A0A2T8KX49_9POAL|nr:subtilisin-like protease SBT1.2 isoform X1 [Panicum hallii]PVH66758.1 hypothetical protein PAHAL_1G339200 [Panicum hallii]